ncbi:hypothetical protein D3C75_1076110 [compost metagenome]
MVCPGLHPADWSAALLRIRLLGTPVCRILRANAAGCLRAGAGADLAAAVCADDLVELAFVSPGQWSLRCLSGSRRFAVADAGD